MVYGKKDRLCCAMNETDCIKMFKELIQSNNSCLCGARKLKSDIDFEMDGPLWINKEKTQFIVKCKKCGYCHSMHIPTRDALKIRKYCLKEGLHTSERFQKLDCYICKNGENMQWQCYYFPKAMMKECKGFFKEENEFDKYIACKIFPE